MKQFLLLIISSLLFAVPAYAQAWDDDGEADNRLNRSDSLKMSRVKYIKLNLGLKMVDLKIQEQLFNSTKQVNQQQLLRLEMVKHHLN